MGQRVLDPQLGDLCFKALVGEEGTLKKPCFPKERRVGAGEVWASSFAKQKAPADCVLISDKSPLAPPLPEPFLKEPPPECGFLALGQGALEFAQDRVQVQLLFQGEHTPRCQLHMSGC